MLAVCSLLIAILVAAPASGEIVELEATLTQAWDPVFHLFPVPGTGSSATGTLHLFYDTDTNLATDVSLQIQGISLADLRTPDIDRAHIHLPNATTRIFNVGTMGLVDVPGGIELVGGSGLNTFEFFEAAILDEQSWINIHTLTFLNGEIAGRLTRVQSSPALTPANLLLLASLLFAGGLLYLRRHS
jgi:hypothetical protein